MMLTAREASAHLREQIHEQVEISRIENAEPNVAIPGDKRVKDEFWTLLEPQEQRALFLHIAGNRHVWPRLRSLVGSPPYSFLRASDEGVLRAGGIRKGRVNMARESTLSTEFRPHFDDGTGRKFRVVDREGGHKGMLPFKGLVPGTKVVVDVRIRASNGAKRVQDLRGDNGELAQAASKFPSANDALSLKPVGQIRHIHNDYLECVVLRVLKTTATAVARLVCVVGHTRS